MRIILSVLFTALFSVSLSAQKYLYIKKGNEIPKLRIGVNERVTFKTTESTKFIDGILNDVTATAMVVSGKTYALSDVEAFRVRNQLLTIGGTAIAGGALLYTSLGLINRIGGKYQGGSFTTGEWVTVASLFGGGLLMRWLGKKTYSKDKGWKWEIIDLNQTE